MNTMPVAPEKLITMFSLSQVAEMIVAFEDATIFQGETEQASGDEAATVRPNAR